MPDCCLQCLSAFSSLGTKLAPLDADYKAKVSSAFRRLVLLEALRGGIIPFAALHQVAFHRFDLLSDLGQDREQRLNHRQTIGGHIGQHRFMERFTGRVAHGMAKALEGETDGVDEVDTGAHQSIAQFKPQQIVLGLGGAMLDGVE